MSPAMVTAITFPERAIACPKGYSRICASMPGNVNGSVFLGLPSSVSRRVTLMPGSAPALYVDCGGLLAHPAVKAASRSAAHALHTNRARAPCMMSAVRAHLARLEIEGVDAKSRTLGQQFQVMLSEMFVHNDVIFPRRVNHEIRATVAVEAHVRAGVLLRQRRAVLEHDHTYGLRAVR